MENAVSNGASDIHFSTGGMPAYRLYGNMCFFNEAPLTNDEIDQFLAKYISAEQYETLKRDYEIDCSVHFRNDILLRVNAFSQIKGLAVSMRVVPAAVPPLPRLGFPRAINNLFNYRDGLILVTGPTGSGKSTTIASVIEEFNKTDTLHIVTIEDPIEYKFESKKSLINQREIGRNTHSYNTALRSALREDPDIIFVGEMRDIESISIALTAAETGHLVLSTLHTVGSAKTIDRLIDVFPPNQQYQIRSQLSTSLRAVVSQRLLPRKDKKGRVVAYELMYINSAISNLIRENKIPLINQTIQTGKSEGMITLNMCIDNLVAEGLISQETAADYKTKT